jgi:hypothetical protein
MRNKSFNKLTAFIMVICMLASMLLSVGQPITVYAEEPAPWTGSGIEADPYLISTNVDLAALSDPDNVQFLSAYFLQTDDIDLSTEDIILATDDIVLMPEYNWVAIGDESHQFTGTYDGAGYTISNLTIDDDAGRLMGLFGCVGVGGTLVNIRMEGATISSNNPAYYGGGFIGSLVVINYGTVSNSSSSSAIFNYSADCGYLGGLVAGNAGTIKNSYSSGYVNSHEGFFDNTVVGGLVGTNGGINGGTILDSYSTFQVSQLSGSGKVGGLVGANSGTISNSYSTGIVTGSGNVGGLVGNNGTNGEVSDSYYDSDTSGQSDNTGRGTPKTTAEMMQLATFQSWDFENAWKIEDGSSYPSLQWQSEWTPEEEASQAMYFISQDIILAGEALTWDVIKGGNNDINNVTEDVCLPLTGENGTTISWSSSSPEWINAETGEVTRPTSYDGEQWVDLTATISKSGGTNLEKVFGFMVMISDPDAEAAIELDLAALTWNIIKGNNVEMDNITGNLAAPLPEYGDNGSTISWSASLTGWINLYNGAVRKPNSSEGDQNITLTATVSKEWGTSQMKEFPLVIKAADWVWEGDGSQENPYLVESAIQLNDLHFKMVENESVVYFIQTMNIDLSSYSNWTPIDNFAGTYNGNGYTISNLKINNDDVINYLSYVGLFGSVEEQGRLENIKLDNVDISSPYGGSTASLVGSNSGTVSQSSSNGNVTSGKWAYLGGLVGENHGTIESSYSNNEVIGVDNAEAGGLVGENDGTIEYSYSTSQVEGSDGVGGLVALDYGTISDSYYDSDTSGQSDTGKGIPKTTAEMMQQATFEGWDFENTWEITNGDSYPKLQCESWNSEDVNAIIAMDSDALTWEVIKGNNPSTDYVFADITLPKEGERGTTVSWSASTPEWINTTTGEVTRPTFDDGEQLVDLTATISMAGGISQEKVFSLKIIVSDPTAEADITSAIAALTWDSIKGDNAAMDSVTGNLVSPLPSEGANGTLIRWHVSQESYLIDSRSGLVRRPYSSEGDTAVTLIASIGKEWGTTQTKEFNLIIKAVDWDWLGDGSQENPYQVESSKHLNDVRFKMLEGMERDLRLRAPKSMERDLRLRVPESMEEDFLLGAPIGREIVYFSQTADINLSSYSNWIPIERFQGSYNGNGYTISNLKISNDILRSSGLFGTVEEGGGLENIKLVNVDIRGSNVNRAIIGSLACVNFGTVSKCSSNGIAIGGEEASVGGLISGNFGTIRNSYSDVEVTGADSIYIGGLVGYNEGIIEYSYSTGQVNPGISMYVGGLLGENNGTVSYSYYNSETSGQSDTGKGTPKTTLQMKQQTTFENWDFESAWEIINGDSYPKLQFERLTTEEIDALITIDRNALTWDSIKGSNNAANSVTANLNLQSSGVNGTTITWSASPTGWVNTISGDVTRPSHSQRDKTVTLTATISMTGGTDQIKSFTLTIKARASTRGSGGSSTPAPIPPPTNNSVITGSALINTIPVSINSVTGSGTVNLEQSLAEALFGSEEAVNITIPTITGVDSYSLEMPVSVLSKEQAGGVLILSTDVASITITDNMLSGVSEADGKIAGINIGRGDKSLLSQDVKAALGDKPLVKLILTLDGKQVEWNNLDAPVTVSIPYIPTAAEVQNPEHIVIWYIDGSGNAISVPSGKYDPETGVVTFTTTHFSEYAVAYVTKTFNDLGSATWAKKPIEVMISKGIISGTGKDTYSPGFNITRADYLVFLVNTLGLTVDFDTNFDDVKQGDYYYEALGIARKLGIATGSGNNKFNPKANISRQDMMVLTARALEKFKKLEAAGVSPVLGKFKDKGDIAGYATDGMAALVREGLIAGSGDMINPQANTTRAEAAVFLYRIYNKY